MSETDLEEVRKAAERMGEIVTRLKNLEMRIGRIETAILAILAGGAALYLRSVGILP